MWGYRAHWWSKYLELISPRRAFHHAGMSINTSAANLSSRNVIFSGTLLTIQQT
jgi:hypothetical protein